jgi:hypothetical protein
MRALQPPVWRPASEQFGVRQASSLASGKRAVWRPASEQFGVRQASSTAVSLPHLERLELHDVRVSMRIIGDIWCMVSDAPALRTFSIVSYKEVTEASLRACCAMTLLAVLCGVPNLKQVDLQRFPAPVYGAMLLRLRHHTRLQQLRIARKSVLGRVPECVAGKVVLED